MLEVGMQPTLDSFQHEVLEFMDNTGGRCIYADPVGARKTGTTLTWVEQQEDLPHVLVVAPKAVHSHWAHEAGRFAPSMQVFSATGKAKATRKSVLGQVALAERAIYITTYESMKADEADLKSAIWGQGFDTVVFDEGHRLKGRRTGVALTANAVTLKPECCLIVTGTPIMNSADEMWQYLHMLDRKAYPSFRRWVEYFFNVEYTTFHGKLARPVRVIHDPLPERMPELRAQLAKVMIQRKIHELFPGEAWVAEPEHVVVPVTLTPAERKAYDKLVKHGWAVVGKEDIATDNQLARNTRLRQLGSDWGTLDSSLPDGAKVVAAAELIGDLARRETIVAFTGYKESAERLVARLNAGYLRARVYHGGLTGEEREAVLADYAHGLVDVVVGTIGALGTGVDGLQTGGSSIVMLDRDWTPGVNDQCIGRRRRSGQSEPVSVYHVFAEGTLDVVTVAACLAKTNVIEQVSGRDPIDVIYGRKFKL